MRNQTFFIPAQSFLVAGMSFVLFGCGGEEEAPASATGASNSVAESMAAPAMGQAPDNQGGGSQVAMNEMQESDGGDDGGMGSMQRGLVEGGGMGSADRGMVEGGMGGMQRGMVDGSGMEGMEGYGEEGMEGYGEEGYGGEGMEGYPGGGYGGGQMAGGNSAQNTPAVDFTTWTRDDFLEAVRKRDRRILVAIPMQSETSVGNPEFAGLMTDVLAELSNDGTGAGGPNSGTRIPGFPPGLEPGGALRGKGPLVPPGGASLDRPHRLFKRSGNLPIDSLDAMIGETILAYLPQAAQGTRGAAGGIPNRSASGFGSSSQGQNSQQGSSPPGMMGSGMEGEMEYGMEGEGEGEGAYQDGQGYPGQQGFQSQQNSGNQVQPGLTEQELVQAVVAALVRNNTLPGWQTLKGIVDGAVPTTLSSDENIQLVVTDTFSASELNADMAEQILNAGINGVLNAPADHPASLEVMAALSSEPLDYFFGFSTPETPAAQTPNNSSGMGGGAANGMAAAMGGGMSLPGLSAGGAGGGMSRPGLSAGGAGGGMSRPGLSAGGAGGGMSRPGLSAGGSGGGMSRSGLGAGGSMGEDYESEMSNGYGGEYGSGYSQQGYPGMQGFVAGTAAGTKMLNVSLAGQFPAAKALWSPSTIERLTQVLSSNGGSHVQKLAASIPNDHVRHALFETFTANYQAGANDNFGSLTTSYLDPGMLAILKGLPRVRPARANADPDPKRAVKDSWVSATKMMVISLRERLRVAATRPELAYTGTPKLRLHRNAVAEQSIAIVVPNESTESLGESAPSPTKIYYTKTTVSPENRGQQENLIAHYEKYSKGFKRADAASGVMWFDGVTRNTDGTRQTMDVLIQQAGAGSSDQGYGGEGGEYGGESGGYDGESSGMANSRGGPGMGGGGGGVAGGAYSIEVIVIVTRDPQDPTDETAVTTANIGSGELTK